MDPDRYCLDEAAPPGSSLHYATLFLRPRERAACVAVHALRHTLIGILDTIADPNVRAHKLNWWSSEIMEARDGHARHPVAVAITRHGTTRIWRHPEVLAMLTAVGRVSAASGFESEAARDRFCEAVGGGTARLCAATVGATVAVAAGTSDEAGVSETGARDDVGALGSALEYAMLASVPTVRSGLRHAVGGSGATSQRIAEERARAHQALADAVRDAPLRSGPVGLVYRTLAHIQLAALAGALRKPAPAAPLSASITPIRKLWIAWRIARRDR